MYDVRLNQSDLASICADRQLQTDEIHPSNDFYGQASLLKWYAGLPESYSLKGVLEHAPQITSRMWDNDKTRILPVNFAISDQRGRLTRKLTGRHSISIGFGYQYGIRLFEQMFPELAETPAQRRGTIAFPTHSTHLIKADFDHADYARRLLELPQEMQPITVCMYWKDYLHGTHQPYVDAGIPVVSAGHMFDRDFMLRLHDICRQFEWAVSNEQGTHLFASTVSGAKFVYVDSAKITHDIPKEAEGAFQGESPEFNQTRKLTRQLFSDRKEEISPGQLAYVDRIMGTDFVKSPQELRTVFDQAEHRDRRVGLSLKESESENNGLPAYWQRSRKMSAKWIRSIHKRIPGSRKAA